VFFLLGLIKFLDFSCFHFTVSHTRDPHSTSNLFYKMSYINLPSLQVRHAPSSSKVVLHESPTLKSADKKRPGRKEKRFFPIIVLFCFGLDTEITGHMLFFAWLQLFIRSKFRSQHIFFGSFGSRFLRQIVISFIENLCSTSSSSSVQAFPLRFLLAIT
jgi:hypothetical protein